VLSLFLRTRGGGRQGGVFNEETKKKGINREKGKGKKKNNN